MSYEFHHEDLAIQTVREIGMLLIDPLTGDLTPTGQRAAEVIDNHMTQVLEASRTDPMDSLLVKLSVIALQAADKSIEQLKAKNAELTKENAKLQTALDRHHSHGVSSGTVDEGPIGQAADVRTT